MPLSSLTHISSPPGKVGSGGGGGGGGWGVRSFAPWRVGRTVLSNPDAVDLEVPFEAEGVD